LTVKRAFCAILAALATGCAQEKPVDANDAPDVISHYFDRLDSVYKAGSTEADIENLLDLMTPDVRYVHKVYEADFDLESWRAAFNRIQTGGGYQNPDTFCSAITKFIPGNGYHAVEYAAGSVSGNMCIPNDDTRMLIVFSLRDGKLARIEELW
jgi:hypothetical protein